MLRALNRVSQSGIYRTSETDYIELASGIAAISMRKFSSVPELEDGDKIGVFIYKDDANTWVGEGTWDEGNEYIYLTSEEELVGMLSDSDEVIVSAILTSAILNTLIAHETDYAHNLIASALQPADISSINALELLNGPAEADATADQTGAEIKGLLDTELAHTDWRKEVGIIAGTVAAGDDARLSDARTPIAHNQDWSTITSTPTTVSGYGITDAEATGAAAAVQGNLNTHTSTADIHTPIPAIISDSAIITGTSTAQGTTTAAGLKLAAETHGGSGGSTLLTTVDISTDADISATAGNIYAVTATGYTANRTLTLPTGVREDRVGVMLESASASYALIISGAIGGGTGEWSRLVVTGEYVEFICVADGAWMLAIDFRKRLVARAYRSTDITNGAVATSFSSCQLNATTINTGGMFSAGFFIARRPGVYLVNHQVRVYGSFTDSTIKSMLWDATTPGVQRVPGPAQKFTSSGGSFDVVGSGLVIVASADVGTNAAKFGLEVYSQHTSALDIKEEFTFCEMVELP